MKMRHLLPAVALAAALVAVPAYAYGPSIDNPYASETGVPLTVHVDGKYVSTDVDPYLKAGRTYLPLRAAAESMGAAVEWDGATRSITVTKDSTVIRCSVGSAAFTVNGTTRYSDAAPEIRDGRTMLPIRPIAEALGGSLEWDGYTASVTIDTPAADAPAPTLPNDIPSEVRWLVEKYYVPADGQGNGSWQCVMPSDKVYSALRYTHNYLFISEMANGTKNAVMVGYGNIGYPSIGADRMDVVTTSGKLQLKDTWSPHYWHGAGIGGIASMYLLVDYDYDGDNLHLSGAMAKNSYPTPGWKDTYYNLDATFVPFGETASVEPEDPVEPSKPVDPTEPTEPEEPVEPDEPNEPPTTHLDGTFSYERYAGDEDAPEWMVSIRAALEDDYTADIYVTKPKDMTNAEWEALKDYYRDDPRPSGYPSFVDGTSLKSIQKYMDKYIHQLNDDMREAQADEALSAGSLNGLVGKELDIFNKINFERQKEHMTVCKASPILCEAAEIRAREILDEFSLKRPDGRDADTVLDDLGLADFNDELTSYGDRVDRIRYGEKLSYKSGGPYSVEDVIEDVKNSCSLLGTDNPWEYMGLAEYTNDDGLTAFVITYAWT